MRARVFVVYLDTMRIMRGIPARLRHVRARIQKGLCGNTDGTFRPASVGPVDSHRYGRITIRFIRSNASGRTEGRLGKVRVLCWGCRTACRTAVRPSALQKAAATAASALQARPKRFKPPATAARCRAAVALLPRLCWPSLRQQRRAATQLSSARR